jgi:hypothetical protein
MICQRAVLRVMVKFKQAVSCPQIMEYNILLIVGANHWKLRCKAVNIVGSQISLRKCFNSCTQFWSFQQFTVIRNTSYYVCFLRLPSHKMIIKQSLGKEVCSDIFLNPIGPFCTHPSKDSQTRVWPTVICKIWQACKDGSSSDLW